MPRRPLALTSSPDCGPSGLPLGSTTPRIWTRPLVKGRRGPCGCGCALTRRTSYGFAVEDFAREVLGAPLDPWERWAAIHGGELLPDGRPRFRILLLIVARQNGKTHLLVVLTLFWLFVDQWPLVLGTSTNLRYAQEPWEKAVALATDPLSPLHALMPPGGKGVRRTNGENRLTTLDRCRYEIATSNERGGRSLSIDRLVQDELREQHDWSAWNAAVPATNARPNAQVWCISNQGGPRSVVLRSLRGGALAFVESGEGDQRTGLFEWSAPPGRPLDDVEGLAAANPNAGHRISWDTLLGDARRVMASGDTEAEAGFRTEVRCEEVSALHTAIDLGAWAGGLDPAPLVGEVRRRLAAVLDVSPSGDHVTLAVAAPIDGGRYRVEVVEAWEGPGCTAQVREELPGLLARVKPRKFGWLPMGPAAAVAADLRERKPAGWPPRGVVVEEIRADTPAACMGLADLVKAGLVVHSGDALLDAQLAEAEPQVLTGERWVFSRRGGPVDAVYAAAGAVHMARSMPTLRASRVRVLWVTSERR